MYPFFPTDDAPTTPAVVPPATASSVPRILIVDDSRTTRSLIRRDLGENSYEIREATQGLEAIDIIRNGFTPDLITLDINMPKLGGLDTCKKLYGAEFKKTFAHCKDHHVPVVFITASDSIADRRRGFELGAVDFVPKQFEPGELNRVVERILRSGDRLKGVTALVVDDSCTVRHVISDSLRQEGANVLEAKDSHEALEIICNVLTQIDIVVTDLEMPGLDGTELCLRIRRELGLKDLPVLFLTGVTDQTRRLAAFRAGATDCISKPFIKEEMVARLLAYTERYRFERRLRALVSDTRNALEFKESMIATLSHDMRTPLNAILGFADLLNSTPGLDEAARENVTLIQESGRLLLHLTETLLTQSHADATGTALGELTVPLADIVSQSVRVLRTLADRKQLTLSWENRSTYHNVSGHPQELLRVLNNLVGNAIKFTPSGGRVRAVVRDAGEGRVAVSISDSGIGIPADKIPRLFDRFTDTSQRGTARESSTGLGLSIVKQLIEKHRGTIEVHSVMDKGTEFRITLPTVALPEPVPLNPPTLTAPSAPTTDLLQGLRVLIAEDNSVNRRIIQSILSKAGSEITFVEDGEAAVDAFQKAPAHFQAILMDVEMPKLDGYAATRLIRSAGCIIPIIAMTAHTSPTAHQSCLDAGMNAVLTKPFKPTCFADLLHAHKKSAGPQPAL